MSRNARIVAGTVAFVFVATGIIIAGMPVDHGRTAVFQLAQTESSDGAQSAVIETSNGITTIELAEVRPAGAEGEPDRLRITEGAAERLVPLTPGHTFDIASRPAYVESIHTWSGVLDDAAGSPLVSVSLRYEGNWLLRRQVLRPGVPLRVDDRITLMLEFSDSRTRPTERPADEPRWAIVDGDRIHWFTNFRPGTGLTLDDGTRVTLLGRQAASEDHPERLVLLEESAAEPQQILVDAGTESGRFWYLKPDDGGIRIDLHATPDRRAEVRIRFPDGFERTESLEDGESIVLAERALFFAIHRIRESAVAVSPTQSPFFEATLRIDDASVHVRQGEVVRVGDAMLRYVRRPDYQSTAFDLRIADVDGQRDVTLNPGDATTVYIGDRPHTLRHAGILPGEHVLVDLPESSGVSPLLVGGILIVLGIAGLVGLRRFGN